MIEQEGDILMAPTPSESQSAVTVMPGAAQRAYEPPVVLATFQKRDLADELPENLTPHIHSVQSS